MLYAFVIVLAVVVAPIAIGSWAEGNFGGSLLRISIEGSVTDRSRVS